MRIVHYLLTAIFVVITSSASATTPLKAKIDEAITQFAKNHTIQAIYAIAHDGKIFTQGAQGYSDFEKNSKFQISQIMPIASGTKTFTAAGILLLQERGLLNVHDTIAKHFPLESAMWNNNKLPSWAHKVTLHHLLTHSSGLREYIPHHKINIVNKHHDINKEILQFAATENLQFKPGSKAEYCNTGFVILGMVIEKLTQQPLADFFAKEFFQPLAMDNTYLVPLQEAIDLQQGKLYSKFSKRYYLVPTGKHPKIVSAQSDYIAVPFADGGIVSTAKDLIKWNEALHHEKIISRASYDMMIKPYYPMANKDIYPTKLGYGIYITTLPNGKLYYHHEGRALAIRSDNGYIPADNLSLAILSNVMVHAPKEHLDKVDFELPANQLDILYFRNAILQTLY